AAKGAVFAENGGLDLAEDAQFFLHGDGLRVEERGWEGFDASTWRDWLAAGTGRRGGGVRGSRINPLPYRGAWAT
ncbi:hypothetical protein, partial [Sphingomonas sp. GM_Shp_2]|uniref:hypothetical protein n=1 Tax=Sphingomonas sp. GM_Shp_2 TaxID=2937380 RepID=UPI002269B05F